MSCVHIFWVCDRISWDLHPRKQKERGKEVLALVDSLLSKQNFPQQAINISFILFPMTLDLQSQVAVAKSCKAVGDLNVARNYQTL